jgi:hypothetical protein
VPEDTGQHRETGGHHAPNGGYSATASQFTLAGVDNSVLHALSTADAAGNGVYAYSPDSSFPGSTWQGTNYWVDVVFDTASGVPNDTTAPTLSISTPVATPTYATSVTPLAIGGTAADNVGVAQVSWSNDRGGSGVAASTSWTASELRCRPGPTDFGNGARCR